MERSADSLSGYSQIGTTGLNVTSYNDNSLTADTRYFYRVRAYNAIGNSAYSNIVGVTTATAPSTGDGLIAYWPLDNSSADMSGNSYNLSLVNGPVYYHRQPAGNTLPLPRRIKRLCRIPGHRPG